MDSIQINTSQLDYVDWIARIFHREYFSHFSERMLLTFPEYDTMGEPHIEALRATIFQLIEMGIIKP